MGDLWRGEVVENILRLKDYLNQVETRCFATVGDYVSYHILEAGIHPDIVVVDHKIMRKSVDPIEFDRRNINVSNPPGTITAEAQSILFEAAIGCSHLAVIVDGEEDLLVLPLMVYLPVGSLIIYGQPREGMVVISLNDERKRWAMGFMSEMER